MDEELQKYQKRLEKAINEALTESTQINSIIHQIQDDGYDVFMIVEATVGFNRPEEKAEVQEGGSKVRLELTSQDERFLRQWKISPD